MRPQVGPANLPLGKCPFEAWGSGNTAEETEAPSLAPCSGQRRAAWGQARRLAINIRSVVKSAITKAATATPGGCRFPPSHTGVVRPPVVLLLVHPGLGPEPSPPLLCLQHSLSAPDSALALAAQSLTHTAFILRSS
jgi:hypothetical protein